MEAGIIDAGLAGFTPMTTQKDVPSIKTWSKDDVGSESRSAAGATPDLPLLLAHENRNRIGYLTLFDLFEISL